MEILTDRLLLRPPVPTDASGALEMLLDPQTARWNPAPEVVNLDTAAEWCERGGDWTERDHTTWHAILPATQELIANVSVFSINHEQRTAKVGYRVAPAYRGRGFGRESLVAVSAWVFSELSLVRIQLEHAVDNPRSCSLAEAAGYRLEGVLRSSYADPEGDRHDEHVHGRLASDPAPLAPTPNRRSPG
jgi:RimJ/RimL family protein N-acetyltransferase